MFSKIIIYCKKIGMIIMENHQVYLRSSISESAFWFWLSPTTSKSSAARFFSHSSSSSKKFKFNLKNLKENLFLLLPELNYLFILMYRGKMSSYKLWPIKSKFIQIATSFENTRHCNFRLFFLLFAL